MRILMYAAPARRGRDRGTNSTPPFHGRSRHGDDCATLDDLREAVTTLEDVERTARRVLGGAHPLVPQIERSLESSRDAFRARETPSGEA